LPWMDTKYEFRYEDTYVVCNYLFRFRVLPGNQFLLNIYIH
jgi:hypothetical protein